MDDFQKQELDEYVELFETLLDDFDSKPKQEGEKILKLLKSDLNTENLLKIQEDLETLTNFNIDKYSRTVIMDLVTCIESIVNS